MNVHIPIRLLGFAMAAGLVLTGCAPGTPSGTGDRSSGAPAPTKTLRIGTQLSNEPASPAEYGRAGSGSSAQENFFIFHANLTALDAQSNLIPRIAEKIPTVADGDWRILPNGGMEVTWKIRPNVFWHDGTPLSAEDYVFSFEVINDDALAAERGGQVPDMERVQALDSRTLLVTWKKQSIFGNVNSHDGLPIMPRHLLEPLYRTGDKVAFENSPLWRDQFVGLGPYRLTSWTLNTQMEAQAFDQYFLGRPKIDRLIIKFVGDVNALVANILAGEIDAITAGAQLDIGQMVAIRQVWQSSNAGQLLFNPKSVRTLYLQMRDSTAPWVGDVRIRQALMHGLDRDGIVEGLLFGLTQRADYYIPPDEPVHRMAEERRLPKYAFDQAQVERLLGQAGYTRGADRLFRNSSGQPIQIDVTVDGQGDNVKEAETVAAQWSAAGFQSRPTPYPAGVGGEEARKIRHSIQGVMLWPWNFGFSDPRIGTSYEVGTERNRWQGGNYGGYANPQYDALWDQLSNELDVPKRREVHFQMVKHLAEEVPVFPLFYRVTGTAVQNNVHGLTRTSPLQAATVWNIHEWEIR